MKRRGFFETVAAALAATALPGPVELLPEPERIAPAPEPRHEVELRAGGSCSQSFSFDDLPEGERPC